MANNSTFRLEWIIIIVLAFMIVGGVFFFTSKIQKANALAEEAGKGQNFDEKTKTRLKNYEDLEKAYNKALTEIDQSVNSDDMNLEILKKNLANIISDIQKQREVIMSRQPGKDTVNDSEYTQQLKDMLSMSKEVLADRLAELQQENASLVKTNQKLVTQNEKLEIKIQKANEFYEEEKAKNVQLNEIIGQVNISIQQLQNQGNTSKAELLELRKKKEVYEKKLVESNKIIENQNNQISDLGTILRKVNVESYFLFEEGNKEEQAKIYLTPESLSARYVKYFSSKKPALVFDFNINQELFEDGVEKVEFKLFNSSNVEVFSISRTISGNKLQIKVANKNLSPGIYSVQLRSGSEDLIIGGKYKFKLG